MRGRCDASCADVCIIGNPRCEATIFLNYSALFMIGYKLMVMIPVTLMIVAARMILIVTPRIIVTQFGLRQAVLWGVCAMFLRAAFGGQCCPNKSVHPKFDGGRCPHQFCTCQEGP